MPAGSGVASYSIYVSDNGGGFTPWLTNTTLTNQVYTGTAGHSYAFSSVASDHVGNLQSAQAVAQADDHRGTIRIHRIRHRLAAINHCWKQRFSRRHNQEQHRFDG